MRLARAMRIRRSAVTVALALSVAVAFAAPVTAAPVKFRITLSPSPMSFGSVPVGEMSAPQLLYATNRSVMPLRFSTGNVHGRPSDGDIELSFAPAPTSCFNGTDIVIQPGQTCGMISLAYMPGSKGPFYLDISMTFTDGVSDVTVTSTAKGKGV